VGNAQNVQNAGWLSYLFMTVAIGSAVAGFERLGLPMHVLKALLKDSPSLAIAGSETIIDQMSSRQYGSETWTIDNMVAALDHVIAFADRLKIDTSVMKPIRDLYAKASTLGFGSRDVAALYEAIIPRS
jgi:3-hydroxyisobutyrate dehydrogenase-like beta-hydroxyacid dehydrogenase